ncbi:MAG: hypothetical protein IT250_16080 [Chitinophagaceae bacterium]|nr:hypothetical protein [Chitinophagaceae bacterium]
MLLYALTISTHSMSAFQNVVRPRYSWAVRTPPTAGCPGWFPPTGGKLKNTHSFVLW